MDVRGLNKTIPNDSFWDFKGKVDFVDTWPLMGTPYPVIIIVALYFGFVIKIGPQHMKNRSPYNLNNLLVAYNAVQVLVSYWIMFAGVGFLGKHGVIRKQCVIRNNADEELFVVKLGYYYLLAKVSELLDTIFFVLRKKQSQVTFLHLYHHTFMLCMMWIGLKYEPNENIVFLGTINSGVHVIMYAYYGLSAFPALKNYLWWKKYITTLQLVQFVTVFIHILACQAVSECPPSKALLILVSCNALFFYFLFNNFYKKSYSRLNRNVINDNLAAACILGEHDSLEKNTYNIAKANEYKIREKIH